MTGTGSSRTGGRGEGGLSLWDRPSKQSDICWTSMDNGESVHPEYGIRNGTKESRIPRMPESKHVVINQRKIIVNFLLFE